AACGSFRIDVAARVLVRGRSDFTRCALHLLRLGPAVVTSSFGILHEVRIKWVGVVFALLRLHQQFLRCVCLNGSILLARYYILNLFPTLLTFGNAKSASHRLWTAQSDDEINCLRVIRQTDIGFGWGRRSRTGMGMIYGQQIFTAVAHLALRCEEIFGGRFVRDYFVGREIAQGINAFCGAVVGSANQATTFGGDSRERVRKNLIAM